MIRNFLDDFLGRDVATILSRSLIPIAILLIVFLLRRLIPVVFRAILERLSFVTRRTDLDPEMLRDKLMFVLVPPTRYLVTVIGLWIIVAIIELPNSWHRDLNTVFVSLIMLAFFWLIFRTINVLFTFWHERARGLQGQGSVFDETLIQFLTRLAEATVIIFAIVTIMQQWGINLTGILAGLGLGGLAFALAAQDALANLIGYFSIIADAPFKVGDYVIADSFEGVVEVIGFRTTRIRRPDRAVIYVPNRIIANEVLTNWSQAIHGPRRGQIRLHMTLGVTYSTTADQMEDLVAAIRDYLKTNDSVIGGSIIVNFVEFGSSSLDIMIACSARATSWSEVQDIKEKINLSLMRILEVRGLEVAFPTRTVVLEQNEPSPPALPLGDALIE